MHFIRKNMVHDLYHRPHSQATLSVELLTVHKPLSLEPRLSILDFANFSPKLRDKIRNREPQLDYEVINYWRWPRAGSKAECMMKQKSIL